MVDDLALDAWQEKVVADIIESRAAELAAVVVCWAAAERKRSWWSSLVRLELHRTSELYDLYERICARKIGARVRHSQRRDIRCLAAGTPIVDIVPQRERGVFDAVAETDLERLQRLDLDVLVRFGFRILRGRILTLPRWGVWSFHHGDETAYRGGPSCFWEMAAGEKVVGCILQILSERLDGGRVIYRSYSSCPETLWVGLVRERHYLKSSAFVCRCLEYLHRKGRLPSEPAQGDGRLGKLYRRPGNLRAAWELGRLAGRSALRSAVNAFRSPRWSVALRAVDESAPVSVTLDDFQTIPTFGGCNVADPNLMTRDGVTHCFVERCLPDSDKGHIACFRLGDGGSVSEPRTVIERPHHLSYPFLFDWRGEVYMAVEAAGADCIEVFRAEAYPLVWVEAARMLEGCRAYDPTLFEHEGKWYLFTVVDERGGGAFDEAFLYVADSPLGPWTAHPLNPIVSDVREARPAGPLFRLGDRLLRPAQDCSGRYGRAINLCEVTELSPQRYAQRVVDRIDPRSRGKLGCHTITRSGGYEMIDERSYVARLPLLSRRTSH